MTGIFCELFGQTPRNAVLEYFLEARELDHAACDIIDELNMNRATTYATIKLLLDEHIITPTRIIGKTQLYALNKNENTKALLQVFNMLLKQSTTIAVPHS